MALDHAPRELTWAMAQQLERLLDNAWSALSHHDPLASELEFRVAVITAAARVTARRRPPSENPDRQTSRLTLIFAEQLSLAVGRPAPALLRLPVEPAPDSPSGPEAA